jgi:hypothetical protein
MIELPLGEISVRVITIDEAITSKEKLGRPKDTAALSALYATRRRSGRRRLRDPMCLDPEMIPKALEVLVEVQDADARTLGGDGYR